MKNADKEKSPGKEETRCKKEDRKEEISFPEHAHEFVRLEEKFSSLSFCGLLHK